MICPHRDCRGADIPTCDWRAHAANHLAATQRAAHAAKMRGPGLPAITEPNAGDPYRQCAAQTAYERQIYGD